MCSVHYLKTELSSVQCALFGNRRMCSVLFENRTVHCVLCALFENRTVQCAYFKTELCSVHYLKTEAPDGVSQDSSQRRGAGPEFQRMGFFPSQF